MNGKLAKKLRRLAKQMTVGKTEVETKKVYKRHKNLNKPNKI